MSQIYKIKLENASLNPNFADDASRTKLKDREDAGSIKKAQTVSQSLIGSQDIASKSDKKIILEPSLITMDHPAMDPEYLQTVDNELGRLQTNPEPHEVSYLIKVRDLIAQVLAQFNEISQRDRAQTEGMTHMFRENSKKSAELQRSLGSAGLWIAGIGFTVLLSQFGFKNPADREVIKFLSEQCPNIGGMFTSRYQANQKEADALAQLMLAEYNAKTSKSQSESNSKQEIVSLLDKALESMKRAASAG